MTGIGETVSGLGRALRRGTLYPREGPTGNVRVRSWAANRSPRLRAWRFFACKSDPVRVIMYLHQRWGLSPPTEADDAHGGPNDAIRASDARVKRRASPRSLGREDG